ncbi:CD1375 family protein [Syntrophomonas curvata]
MIQLYYTLVRQGLRTIDQVPDSFRAEVQTLLNTAQ